MKFIPPAILSLFAITFFGVWLLMDKDRRYLLKLGTGFALFAIALMCKLMFWTSDIGYNTTVSAILYMSGALIFADGILMRSGRRFSPVLGVMWFVTIVGLTLYFYYVDRNLAARIYIVNFGIGSTFLMLVWQARFLRHGSTADKVLFWIITIFTLHFFLRTAFLTPEILTDLKSFDNSPFWRWAQISTAMIGASMGLGLLAVMAADTLVALREERDCDPLTGLLNRRGLERRIQAIQAKGHTSPVSIVTCDVDHFKKINDTYGHATGDAVLKHVAKTIMTILGNEGCAARVGGEEFILVLYERSVQQAYVFTEQLRDFIQIMRFEDLSLVRSVTCSFGVAQLRPAEDFWRSASRADAALYMAKKAGRNQTVAEGGVDAIQVTGVA